MICKIIFFLVTVTATTFVHSDEFPSRISPTTATSNGPYKPSGWKPNGQQLQLPQRQQQQQQRQEFNPFIINNNADENRQRQFKQQDLPSTSRQYVPSRQYGPPITTTETELTTTEIPTTTTRTTSTTPGSFGKLENDLDGSNSNEKKSEVEKGEIEQGIYYVYHPTGLLQRITYQTQNDLRNMAYVAQLKYQDVEPIKEPIYYYDPNTLTLQKLQLQ